MLNKVLVVDDEVAMLRTFRRILDEELYEVEMCLNGEDALRKAASWHPDIIISDYQMPKLDGLTFLNMVSDICPDSVRVLLTGYTDIKVAQQAINEAAVDRFISKPFDADALITSMSAALQDLERKRQLGWTLAAEQASNESLIALNSRLTSQLHEKDLAIESSENFLRSNYGETIRILMMALEQRQTGFFARSTRVAEITKLLVGESGETWLQEMGYTAGLLTEIGYLALPQFEKYPPADGGKSHSYWGMRLLQNSMFSNLIPAAIEAHHENWDGSGPMGLSGMQIPFLARCLRLAEALSTFSSSDTPTEQVISFLDSRNGRAFDPNLTAIAIQMVLKHGVRVFLKKNTPGTDISNLMIPLHA